jgi:23S rRNA (adenine2503-C2)-methyltransferase
MRSRWSISPKPIAGRCASPVQVGCTLTCSFCHTGTQKLVRNLTAAEIVGQVMLARDDLDEWPVPGAPKDETRLVSNIVLMGMGEPLVQFRQRPRRDAIVMDGEGIALGRRRITLSTSGVVPEIARTAEEIGCQLAISSTPPPMRCATCWCRSTRNGTSPRCWTRCATIRTCRTRTDHL